MALPLEKHKSKLNALKKRAEKRKQDPNLRHKATSDELNIYNQHAIDIEEEQGKTLK